MLHRLTASLILAVTVGAVLAFTDPPLGITYAAMIVFSGAAGLFVLLPRAGVRWPPRPFPARSTARQESRRAVTLSR